MACPTCSHTMHNIGTDAVRQFWCPRCGTLTGPFAYGDQGQAPKLVERCRTFEEGLIGECAQHSYEWKRLGIKESIRPE